MAEERPYTFKNTPLNWDNSYKVITENMAAIIERRAFGWEENALARFNELTPLGQHIAVGNLAKNLNADAYGTPQNATRDVFKAVLLIAARTNNDVVCVACLKLMKTLLIRNPKLAYPSLGDEVEPLAKKPPVAALPLVLDIQNIAEAALTPKPTEAPSPNAPEP